MTIPSANFSRSHTKFFAIPNSGTESRAIRKLTVKFSEFLDVTLNSNADWGLRNYDEYSGVYTVPSEWQNRTRRGTTYSAFPLICLDTVVRHYLPRSGIPSKRRLSISRRTAQNPHQPNVTARKLNFK